MDWLLGTYFMPHEHCYGGNALIWWSWVVADLITFMSFVAMPIVILSILRERPDLVDARGTYGFIAFIFLCGCGHLLDALAQSWIPAYGLRSFLGILTASASVWTVVYLHKNWRSFAACHSTPEQISEVQSKMTALQEEADRRTKAFEESARSVMWRIRDAEASQEIIEALADFVIRTDTNNNVFTYSNSKLDAFVGQRVQGMTVSEWFEHCVHPEDVPRTETYYEGTYKKDRGDSLVVNRVLNADPSPGDPEYVWVEWRSATNPRSRGGQGFSAGRIISLDRKRRLESEASKGAPDE